MIPQRKERKTEKTQSLASCNARCDYTRCTAQIHLGTERARSAFRVGRRCGGQVHGGLIVDQRLEHFRRERNGPKFPTLGVLGVSYHLARGVLVAIYAFRLRHLYGTCGSVVEILNPGISLGKTRSCGANRLAAGCLSFHLNARREVFQGCPRVLTVKNVRDL